MPVAANKMPRDHVIELTEHEFWYEGPDYKLLLMRVWTVPEYYRPGQLRMFCHSPEFSHEDMGHGPTIYDVTDEAARTMRGKLVKPEDVLAFWYTSKRSWVTRDKVAEFCKRHRLDLGMTGYIKRLKRPLEAVKVCVGVCQQGWVRGVVWQEQVIDSLSERVRKEDKADAS